MIASAAMPIMNNISIGLFHKPFKSPLIIANAATRIIIAKISKLIKHFQIVSICIFSLSLFVCQSADVVH